MKKKLSFVCPICGGRLIKSVFKTGSDDYYVSKTGKPHKTPFKKASRNLGEIDCNTIYCENYPNSCNFLIGSDFKIEDYNLREKYEIEFDENGNFELFEK